MYVTYIYIYMYIYIYVQYLNHLSQTFPCAYDLLVSSTAIRKVPFFKRFPVLINFLFHLQLFGRSPYDCKQTPACITFCGLPIQGRAHPLIHPRQGGVL